MGFGQYSVHGGRILSRDEKARRGKMRRDVAHAWAHGLKESGRNSTGSLYFSGATVYSYGPHFAIARHVERKGQRCVLFTTRDYSITTSGHKSQVRCAIPPGVPVFHVTDPSDAPTVKTLDEYAARVDEALKRAARATKHGEWALRRAGELVEEANAFAAFFGFRRRLALPGDLDAVRERVKKQAAAAAAATKKRLAREAAERTEQLREWARDASLTYQHGFAYMRLNGDRVETTMRADVPLSEVVKVGPMVVEMFARGQTYQRNGERINVGQYTLETITADVVTVGCHKFTRAEVERITALAVKAAAA